MDAIQFPTTIGDTQGLVKKIIDRGRAAEVYVVKQMRTNAKQERDDFLAYYADFLPPRKRNEVLLQRVIRMVRASELSPTIAGFVPLQGSSAVDSVTGEAMTPYVDLRFADLLTSGIVDLEKDTWLVRIQNSQVLGVEDITNISTSQTTTGTSTASVTLKNNMYKYNFYSDILKKGLSVFGPDDIIVIKTEDADGYMEEIFTGYVNRAIRSRSKANNNITLICEDTTKKLRFSRVGIRQGLNDPDIEAKFIPLTAFTLPWISSSSKDKDSAQPASQILEGIFVLSLTNIDDDFQIQTLRRRYEELFKKYNYISKLAPDENKALTEEMESKRIAIEKRRLELISNFSKAPALTAGVSGTLTKSKDVEIFRNKASFISGIKSIIDKKPIAKISGTDQPAFQIIFSDSFNYWVSEWKEASRVASEFADNINYEFFCAEDGTVTFRPVNVSLEHLKQKDRKYYTIQDEYIYNEVTAEDNSAIVNVMYISGDYKVNLGQRLGDIGIVTVVKDNRLYKKYGAKMASPIEVIGLIDINALKVYGTAKMARINSKAFADATLELSADPRIKIGNYAYLPETGSVFYISEMQQNYTVGDTYRQNANFIYRRRPLHDIASQLAETLVFSSVLSDEKKRSFAVKMLDTDFTTNTVGILGLAYSKVLAAMEEMGYEKEEVTNFYPSQSSLKDFYFDGYIWEPTVAINFSDAIAVQNRDAKAKADREALAEEQQTAASSKAKLTNISGGTSEPVAR